MRTKISAGKVTISGLGLGLGVGLGLELGFRGGGRAFIIHTQPHGEVPACSGSGVGAGLGWGLEVGLPECN